MAVFRIEKTRDYTVMSNHHLRDMSLSLKAKGLLSLMLSLPENWDYTMKGLSRICKDGIDSISGGIRELEEHGYLIRERVRGANGQLGSIEYTILEQPKEPTPAQEKPIRENPVQANPTLVTPVQEEPAQLNKEESSNYPSRTDLSSTELSNPIQSNPPTSKNVEEALVNLTDLSPSQRKNRIAELMEQTGLSKNLLDTPVQRLSGGEQRRLALLRSLSISPEFLILDEVTAGLDLISTEAVLQLLEKYEQEHDCAYLVVTHDLQIASRLCEVIYEIEHGKITKKAVR